MLSLVFLTCLLSIIRLDDCVVADDPSDTVIFHDRRKSGTTRELKNVGPLHCGNRSKALTEEKVIGGDFSELGQWPWMAALYGVWEDKVTHQMGSPSIICGASIISDQWILTAAHCLPAPREDLKLTFVRLGDLDLREAINDSAKPVDVPVKRYIIHPKYNSTTSENDIGLVQLSEKVNFTENIYPVCLLSGIEYTYNTYYYSKIAVVAGWGVTEDKFPAYSLKHAFVTLGDCKNNKRLELNGTAKIDYKVVCAGDTHTDSCQGDSGGPLVLENRVKGKYYQAGIVSFGLGCARENYPGVYTKVPAFIGWINKETGLKF